MFLLVLPPLASVRLLLTVTKLTAAELHGGGVLGETVVCSDSSLVKGSVLTKQREESSPGRMQCRRCLWSPALSGPSAGVDLFGGRKNKKCRGVRGKWQTEALCAWT